MARQKLVVGTYGDINCTQRANGTWLARARYCDVDGVVREYRKSGETKNKARANLKAFFVEHTGTFGDGAIAPDDTVQELLDLWFTKMERADGSPNSETLDRYRYHLRWVLDSDKTEHPLGAYQLRHVRPVIIQAALDSAGVSADMRKRIRSVLVRAFNLAVFHEALNGNPATAVPSVPVPKVKKKPVAVEDLDAVRAAIREWANAERRNGPKSVDLPDIVDMLIATGMRIGELLALRWSDIELTAPPARRDDETWFPWLMVNGQITSKGKRVDYGKTHAAIRPIALPDWAVAILRRRKLEQPPNDIDAVFASRNGTWHFPGNIQSRLWHIRQLDEYADAAKDQLGHTSKTVTERHYINRRLVVPDYRAATERLAPRTEPADDPEVGL